MNGSIHIDDTYRDALPLQSDYATHSGNHRNKSIDDDAYDTYALALIFGMDRRRPHICLEAAEDGTDKLSPLRACIHGSRSSSFCFAATVSARRNSYTSLDCAAQRCIA